MTAVLGTEVFELSDQVPVALLVSDLHVPADGGAVLASLRAVLEQARRLRAPVFVLGDLFDSYVSPAQVRVGVWREVAAMFATAVAAGSPVFLLHGNRDFLLGDEFAAASGARIVPGGLRCRLAGADTLLLHGDELCQNDLPYQRAKRWLRHPVTRALARSLPLRLALAVAERARRRSRAVVAGGDQQRFLPTVAAVEASFAGGVQRLVFGHIHRHAHGRCGGGRYWVLPAFDQGGVGLLAADGELVPVSCRAGGEGCDRLPLPGECAFTP